MSKTAVEDDGKIFPLDLFMPEFLRCGSFYYAMAMHRSQLHVGETLVLKPLCVLGPCGIVLKCFLMFSLLIYGQCRTITVSNFLVHRGNTLIVSFYFCERALIDILNVIDSCFL